VLGACAVCPFCTKIDQEKIDINAQVLHARFSVIMGKYALGRMQSLCHVITTLKGGSFGCYSQQHLKKTEFEK